MKIETREQYIEAQKELERIYLGWAMDEAIAPIPFFNSERAEELDAAILEYELCTDFG